MKSSKGLLPIRVTVKPGSTYNHNAKRSDSRKEDANEAVVCYVKDLDQFCSLLKDTAGPENFRALVIDALGLKSTHALVNQCGLRLENVDIVSKDLVFHLQHKNLRTGRLWGDELSEFLKTERIQGKYDILVLDFCGTWGKEIKQCVKEFFRKQLLDGLSVLSITCCFRNNESDWDDQHHDWMQCQLEVIAMSAKYGYFVRCDHPFFRYDGMFVCLFKVIHRAWTMNYDGGIPAARDGRVATDWVSEPVAGLPELRPKAILKKLKK